MMIQQQQHQNEKITILIKNFTFQSYRNIVKKNIIGQQQLFAMYLCNRHHFHFYYLFDFTAETYTHTLSDSLTTQIS